MIDKLPLASFAALLLCASAPCQQAAQTVDPASAYPDRVIVKFREGIVVRLVDGRLVSPDGVDLARVRELLRAHAVERLFTRPVADLDRERAALQKRVPPGGRPLDDLNNFYRVRTAGAAASAALIAALQRLPLVENVHAEFVPVPVDDIPPKTPDFEAMQAFFGPPPSGYGHDAIRSIVGARGQGLRVAHAEGDWVMGHEDIDWLAPANVLGTSPGSGYTSWREHGTACVGILGAGRNGYGVRGFGSDVDRLYLGSLASGSANMINLIGAQLQAGDVVSSSFAYQFTVGSTTVQAPVDWARENFAATHFLAVAGIFYAFAAGNSGLDLGDTNFFGSKYVTGAVSSGGFVIGASGAGNGSRAGFSNYGVRVDANGWGSGVTTTGYGRLFDPNDVKQRYTDSFGGTSAAAPAVAGVIASLCGAVKEQNGIVPGVEEVRTALMTTGTAISGTVGKRPDLGALLALYNLPDGLLVTQDGSVGQSFTLDVSGPAGAAFGVVLSTGRGRVVIGANRPVLLDPSFLLPFASGNVAASGTSTLVVGLPNDPALAGLDFFLQSAQNRGGQLHLTNSAMVWVRP